MDVELKRLLQIIYALAIPQKFIERRSVHPNSSPM